MPTLEISVIKANQTLKQRVVGPLRGVDINDVEGAVERINLVINRARSAFLVDSIYRVEALRSSLISDSDTPERQSEWLESVTDSALELKGMGSLSGFPVVTRLASSLGHFVEAIVGKNCDHNGVNLPTERQIRVLSLCLDAMRQVMQNEHAIDGGAAEKTLVETLEFAMKRFALDSDLTLPKPKSNPEFISALAGPLFNTSGLSASTDKLP